jgi:hypothetical protein
VVEQPICDVNETGINDSTVGPLAIGEAVPALRQRCPAVADTTLRRPMMGWTDSVPALRLIVRGVPVLAFYDSLRTTAGPAGATVTALRVESPFFRTNDSLGVGTSIAKFRNLRGIRVTHEHDSPRVVLLDRRRCGVAYELSSWAATSPSIVMTVADPVPEEATLTGMQIASWPDSIVVVAINVSGCRGNVRDLGVDSITEAAADTAPRRDSLAVSQLPSNTAIAPPAPQPVPAGAPAPTVPTLPSGSGRGDSSATKATPGELSQLKAKLEIPVQGVTKAQLRDTYSEPRGGGTRSHEALDIPAPRGTPVLSATDGTLRKLFSSKAGGLMVYMGDASDRFLLLYGHLDRYADRLK